MSRFFPPLKSKQSVWCSLWFILDFWCLGAAAAHRGCLWSSCSRIFSSEVVRGRQGGRWRGKGEVRVGGCEYGGGGVSRCISQHSESWRLFSSDVTVPSADYSCLQRDALIYKNSYHIDLLWFVRCRDTCCVNIPDKVITDAAPAGFNFFLLIAKHFNQKLIRIPNQFYCWTVLSGCLWLRR